MGEGDDELDLVEVRFLGGAVDVEVMSVEHAARRVGVPIQEVREALDRFGGCDTDGYAVRPHPILYR